MLPHIGEGPGEQVGETLLAEAEDHRCPHIEGVALAFEGTTTAAGDQIPLQDEGLGSLGRQLTGGDQTTDAGTDHNGIPLLVLAHGIASLGVTLRGRLRPWILAVNRRHHREDHLRAHRTSEFGTAAGIDLMAQPINHPAFLGCRGLM